jgi:hypothetical protein
MRKITKNIFEENQRKLDEILAKKKAMHELEWITKHEILRKENLKKLVLLKDELNLTEKIFNLVSGDFNTYGWTEIYSIYRNYGDDLRDRVYIGEDIEYHDEQRKLKRQAEELL